MLFSKTKRKGFFSKIHKMEDNKTKTLRNKGSEVKIFSFYHKNGNNYGFIKNNKYVILF